MVQSEIKSIEDVSKIWTVWLHGDPAAPWIEKYLEEEQQKQIAVRALDLRIKIMEHELETLKMTSQMLKKKG